MAIRARKTKKSIVYWVVFSWQKKVVYERSGTDRREAVRLERQRRSEVKAGTYTPRAESVATTVGQYARAWLDKRKNRSAGDDRRWLEIHVLPRDWFVALPMIDVRPRHLAQLVEELKVAITKETGKPLAAKSVSNVYGVVRTMFRDALLGEVTLRDPCAIPKGLISRRVQKRRAPYAAADALSLMTHVALPPDAMIFNALAFFTGCREGEVCGRRWRDWDRNPKPLSSLSVTTQYEDQPLKTDDAKADHPRAVPVHAELARMLAAWWGQGFEMVYCRKPTSADFIVPHRKTMTAHTKSSAYKMWRRSCDASGVENLTLHSTRHTFISLARRGGARKDVVEQITHNAKGDIVDAYTTWDWKPLCEAVQCLNLETEAEDADSDEDSEEKEAGKDSGGAGNRSGRAPRRQRKAASKSVAAGDSAPPSSPAFPRVDADRAASPHPALAKAAGSLAVQRAAWDDFDALWAESLGIAIGGAK